MAIAEPDVQLTAMDAVIETQVEFASEWRRFARTATTVAILTAPAWFILYYESLDIIWYWSAIWAALTVSALRGATDLITRRFIPWPSLFGATDARLLEEDAANRRRVWTWRWFYRLAMYLAIFNTFFYICRLLKASPAQDVTWLNTPSAVWGWIVSPFNDPTIGITVLSSLAFAAIYMVVIIGPILVSGISSIRSFEPGDAEWGVRLDHVRGQAEAKEEIRRVVTLWQSGEVFELAGGKRERGLLFLGPPGTGKTMLAKAIATGFNSPFVTLPGSGFAATFIGVDAIIVRYLARKARKLAKKWGGQCIIFIDEIDAVGMRRNALLQDTGDGGIMGSSTFYGPWGALNSSGDLIFETPEWRDWLFEQRAPERTVPRVPFPRLNNILRQGRAGMFGGNPQGALNQLLVVMDGIDNPPFFRRVFSNKSNAFLDALYFVPRRIGSQSLRPPKAKPTGDQIYFIGATNVPIAVLDPALVRPGRMGRHVMFRTPTKDDRKDIFDLYLDKVAHDPVLDSEAKRDEIARITNGYSPAMIDQICSMALTNAHHEGRPVFGWQHLVEAMTVVEAGTASNIEYSPDETRAVAIHEAGHAAAAHVYRPELESSRLSVRMRGTSLGHHQFFEREERFGHFQSEYFGDLVHTIGAMAAEYSFYGENTAGVGGDLGMITRLAAGMVGAAGMAISPIELNGKTFPGKTEAETRTMIRTRFETIGLRILNRVEGVPHDREDPLRDRGKKEAASQLIGEAFVTAYNFIEANRDGVNRVANQVVAQKEIYGDDLNRLLDAQNFQKPEIDWTDPAVWPDIVPFDYEELNDRDRALKAKGNA